MTTEPQNETLTVTTLTSQPQPLTPPAQNKILYDDYVSPPKDLRQVKKLAPNTGEYYTFTLAEPPKEQGPHVSDLDQLIHNTIVPSSKPPSRWNNIETVRKLYDEQHENENENETPKRKRKRPDPRQVGRRCKNDTLIKIEEESDDVLAAKLHTQQLILNSSEGEEKKSKTILTKIKGDIICLNNKQYQTYEMFADTRKKALEKIKEQRDILFKINNAENLLSSLLNKDPTM